jgi:1-acyl-sn-glycerol-3-phosphate acyltransferase
MSTPSVKEAIPVISPRLLRWFRGYVRRYLRRHFNAVRLLHNAPPPAGSDAPTVFFLNHASWWDPLVSLHLAATFYSGYRAFAPMDAQALKKYALLRRLGFFPVERGTLTGARRFLRLASSILSQPHHALWLTPQGRFTDVRERPVRFEPGLGHLAARLPGVRFIPVAMEFTWWLERSPEVLVAFGNPVLLPPAASAAGLNAALETALAATQDRLADASQLRRCESFTTLLSGKAGVGGFYDLWRRLRTRARGAAFDPRHADPPV